MKKLAKVSALILLLITLSSVLIACNTINVKKDYIEFYYSQDEKLFVETGNVIKFGDNFRFAENYVKYNADKKPDGFHTLNGSYTVTPKNDFVIGTFDLASVSTFKKDYEKELKASGSYTTTQIKMIINSIKTEVSYFHYKKYMFKMTSVQASRMGEKEDNLTTIDGLYSIRGYTSGGDDILLFKNGKIYMRNTVDSTENNNIYDVYSGTFSVDGDFITIQSEIKDSKGNLPRPMKYLLANIELPSSYGADKDGNLTENDIIQVVYVPIKVMVQMFYTTKSM